MTSARVFSVNQRKEGNTLKYMGVCIIRAVIMCMGGAKERVREKEREGLKDAGGSVSGSDSAPAPELEPRASATDGVVLGKEHQPLPAECH